MIIIFWVSSSFPMPRVNDNLGLWIYGGKGVGGSRTSTYDCGRRFQGISSFFDEATPKTHTSIVVSCWNITPAWLFPHYTGDKTNMYECRLPLKSIKIDINFSCCCWLKHYGNRKNFNLLNKRYSICTLRNTCVQQ